jgi:hypothetical protein
MKKSFLLVFALVAAAACSAPTANHEAPPPTNASSPSAPAAVAMTEAGAIATEKAIWDALKNKDYAAFGNMLAEDSLEVTSDGVFDKAGSTAGIKDFEPSEVALSDWKFLSIDKDAFLITYSVSVKGKFKGKEIPKEMESARASSAWVSRGGKWLAIYHQECPIVKAPPAKSPVKAAASPASTPAPATTVSTTGPDPIANEKIVWDFFKTSNLDAFATLLAADFWQVQPTGVYDKAESLKGLAGFNAAKAELSEWKSLKLDDDAALVTYVFKMPGRPANGERLSSIWIRRDGKWLGIFHHGGTKVMPAPAPTPVPPAKLGKEPGSANPAAKP